MRNIVVVTCLVSLCAAARADGDVFAVLPTQGTGGVTAEAEMVSKVMLIALQERSLALSPAQAVQNATVVHGAACNDAQVACARLVGPDVGASKVVASELWSQMGSFQLRLLVVDVRSGADPGAWQSFTAKDKTALAQVAEDAVLQALRLESYGNVGVRAAPGAEILVDGIARQTTPLLRPLELTVGRHEIEVRLANKAPWRSFVEVEKDKTQELNLCSDGDAVAPCPAGTTEAPDADGGLRGPLLVGGAAGAGVGVVALVVGSVLAGVSAAAYDEYVDAKDGTQSQVDTVLGARNGAIASFVVGGACVVAGAAAAATSMMME